MAKGQVRLSHLTFALVLEELVSGPTTAQALAEHSGMLPKTVRLLLRTMKAKKLVHIAAYDKDTLGRCNLTVYGFGPGRDAKRPTKPRAQVNREYRRRAAGSVLAGSPFAGLMG
jgi:predicted ArsR family transcriptional regulator